MKVCVRWEVLKLIVTWEAISCQRGIMTSVVGSGVIEHGLESYGKIDGVAESFGPASGINKIGGLVVCRQ